MKSKNQRLSKANKKARRRNSRKKQSPPRSAEEFLAKSAAFQAKSTRVAHVLSNMRTEGTSLAPASKAFHVAPQTVLKWGIDGLRQGANGRYTAKPSDHLWRAMVVLTRGDKHEIVIRDSRQATLLGEHWNAVERYLSRGDSSLLRKFRGKSITDAAGKKHKLLTDFAELDRLGNAGVLSFESIYARAA